MKHYKTIQINGKQLRLHRYLMEQKIGRCLTFNEVVHHIDGNKLNNNIENLEIVSRGNHIKLHPEINKKSIDVNFIEIDIEKIKQLRETMSISKIAEYFNVSTMTIWYRMKKNNIKTKKLNEKEIKEIKELIINKNKQRDIAKKYNVSEQLISNIKNNKRYGNK
jgi:Zn-dependent peptidase ImmA (M78 family)